MRGTPGCLVQWPLPLLILFLFDYADYGGTRRFCLALLFVLLTAMGNSLQSVYVLAPLVYSVSAGADKSSRLCGVARG